MSSIAPSSSHRTKVRRGKNRAISNTEQVRETLAAGVVAHVGVTTNEGPIVLPMAYGIQGEQILIHGAIANAMMNAGRSLDVCITVTIVDGLVVARTPFHNSMNYRSVVVRGTATAIDQDHDKMAALKIINDHIAPIWDTARPPNELDFKKTLVLAVPLDEVSAKVRGEDPIDDQADIDGPHWAGVVPLTSAWGQPVSAANLRGTPAIPDSVASLAGTNAH